MSKTSADGARADPTDHPDVEFQRLSESCQRGAFRCGERDLDVWFKEKAWHDHRRLRERVTTIHISGNPQPVGFFSMSIKLERVKLIDARLHPDISGRSNDLFPSVHLSRFAIHLGFQRQRIGTIALGRVLKDFYDVVMATGIFAITLVAIDRDKCAFYSRLGFKIYGPQRVAQPLMFLPAETVVDLVERESD